MDSLKEKTAKGLAWGLMNNGITQALNIVFGIFLGRLLSPGEYGVVAVLTIFTALAGNLQSSGFSQGLANMKAPQARHYNAVFWFNVIVSAAMYAILFLSAPLIAAYFRRPELLWVSRFVFLAFLISSLGIAHGAYMFKNLMVRENTIIGFFALVVSGTAGVALAFRGMSYWSLAWQQVIYISVVNIGRYYYTPWRPTLPVDFSPLRRMFSFSVKILFTTILNTLSANILTFVFGRLFPIRAVGNFAQAHKWDTMAYSFLTGAVAQVAQPVLAQIADDECRERRVFRKMARFTALISFPCMFGLAIVSREFILTALGPKWESCVPLLQMLCLSGAFMPFFTLYHNMAISRGRSDIYLWCNVAQIAGLLALVMCFAGAGITVMVAVYSVWNVVFLLVWHRSVSRITGLRLRDVAADILPFCGVAAAVMAAVWWATARIETLWLLLAARVAAGGGLYFCVLKVLRVKILDECLQFITKKKIRR